MAGAALVFGVAMRSLSAGETAPIRFEYVPIPFVLDNCETPAKHVPEPMAGGVAIFDYNNDGKPDIFFTNGAEMPGLRKNSQKYWNRLFRNDGNGRFTDVTQAASVAGTGYDTGVAVGDYDNDGFEDLFVAGVYHYTLYHNNGDGTFTDVTEQAGLSALDTEYGPLWAEGLLRRNASPTEAEIREALSGNICRCTGYVKIIESVQAASRHE